MNQSHKIENIQAYEPASFRDPDARVFSINSGRIIRALSPIAAAIDEKFRRSGFMDELIQAGLMIENRRVSDISCPDGWAAMVESKVIPFANYPYEWPFSMLKDAALLTLNLTEKVYQAGASLKDASAYNIFFQGSNPVFIDVSSIGEYSEGQPWAAYGQFCEHFLAPLLLEAYKGIPFQPFLRSNLDGISISNHLAPIFGPFSVFKPGVLVHVKLRTMLDRRSKGLNTTARKEVRQMSIPKKAILQNIAGLIKIVNKLSSRSNSVWADYDDNNTYDRTMTERKMAFINSAADRVGGGALAWDVGANTGRYSRLLAKRFDYVVAMDSDPGAIEHLYRSLKGTQEEMRILPLVIDLMNPSPAQGWGGIERRSLFDRSRPDFAIYLALIHHICIGQGVPLNDFLNMVRINSGFAVIEFVEIDDPMGQKILATKIGIHPDYNIDKFRMLVSKQGKVLAEERLSKTRSLFLIKF